MKQITVEKMLTILDKTKKDPDPLVRELVEIYELVPSDMLYNCISKLLSGLEWEICGGKEMIDEDKLRVVFDNVLLRHRSTQARFDDWLKEVPHEVIEHVVASTYRRGQSIIQSVLEYVHKLGYIEFTECALKSAYNLYICAIRDGIENYLINQIN